MPTSEDCLAGLLLANSGWNTFHMSSSEDCLAGLLLANSGWNTFHMSSSEDCLAAWLHASYGCDRFQMSSSEDCLAAWLHASYGYTVIVSKCQALKTAWQGHSLALQGLVETLPKCQAAQTAWQCQSLQALIETSSKCQALKTAWQGHSLQALVETIGKCQADTACGRIVQILQDGCTYTFYLLRPLPMHALRQRLEFRGCNSMQQHLLEHMCRALQPRRLQCCNKPTFVAVSEANPSPRHHGDRPGWSDITVTHRIARFSGSDLSEPPNTNSIDTSCIYLYTYIYILYCKSLHFQQRLPQIPKSQDMSRIQQVCTF